MTRVFVFANMMINRAGSQKDSDHMEKLYRNQLKFGEVSHLTDPSSLDLYRQLDDLKNKSAKIDLFVLLISAHGEIDKIGTNVKLSDGIVPIGEIISKIEINDALIGVPKIMMVNCCRHGKRNKFAKVVQKFNSTDLLLCFSTKAGEYSDRSPTTGSCYITSVYKVFKNNYRHMPIQRMLPIVTSNVWKKTGKQQTPEFTGLKKSIFLC